MQWGIHVFAGKLDPQYNAEDNKTAETITGVMSGYGFDTPSGYDDEDRLTNWERDDANLDLSWVLSDVGDWDSQTTNTVTENRTHNAVHELTAIAATALTYDAKGNLTQDEAGIDYTWDMDNMLSEADVPSSPSRGIEGTHAYAYDALGRRVSKTIDDAVAKTSETTVFVSLTQPIPYSPWAGQVLAEYTSGTTASAPLRKYAYGSYIDEPLVMIDRTAAGATAAGTDEPFYYHRNQQYSLVALSNSSGTITERDHYTPYGQTTITDAAGTTTRTSSDVGNPYTYTGRRLDTETGLHYFRYRYYHPPLGCFLGRDPLQYIDGSSVYVAYFAIGGLDPLGLDSLDCMVACMKDNDPIDKALAAAIAAFAAHPIPKTLVIKLAESVGDHQLAKSIRGTLKFKNMSRFTTLPSSISAKLRLGGRSSLRMLGRVASRIVGPTLVAYGLALAAVETHCAGVCTACWWYEVEYDPSMGMDDSLGSYFK